MNPETNKFLMNGKELGKRAPLVFETFYRTMVDNNGFNKDKVFVVPHQLNGHLIEAFREKAGLRRDQVLNNVNKIGNTSNGSVMLALHNGLSKRIRKDDQVLLFGIGIGFDFAYGALIPHTTLIQPQVVRIMLFDEDAEALDTKRTELLSALDDHPGLPDKVEFEFVPANTKEDALSKAVETKPDLLDLNMALGDGSRCVDIAVMLHEKLGPVPTIINVADSSLHYCTGVNFVKLIKFTEFRPLSESCNPKRYADFYVDMMYKANVL